jgi:hypothetical protein
MLEALEYLRYGGGAEWDWIWLDSISLFQDHGLDDIWDDVVKRKPARKEFGLDRGEYGINMFRLAQWVRHVVGTDSFNFGITAHPTEMQASFDDDEPDLLMPYIQGRNMAPKICGYMNIVAYLRVIRSKKTGNPRRLLTARAEDRWYGKDQFDAFPQGKLYDPTIPKMMELINGTAVPATTRRRGRS